MDSALCSGISYLENKIATMRKISPLMSRLSLWPCPLLFLFAANVKKPCLKLPPVVCSCSSAFTCHSPSLVPISLSSPSQRGNCSLRHERCSCSCFPIQGLPCFVSSCFPLASPGTPRLTCPIRLFLFIQSSSVGISRALSTVFFCNRHVLFTRAYLVS